MLFQNYLYSFQKLSLLDKTNSKPKYHFIATTWKPIIFVFVFQNFPHGAKHVHSLILRCCNISDRGLEALMEFLQALYKLEIAGCNEITEQVSWSPISDVTTLTQNDATHFHSVTFLFTDFTKSFLLPPWI